MRQPYRQDEMATSPKGPDDHAPGRTGDEPEEEDVPDTPPTEPQPVPMREPPSPPDERRGPYVVRHGRTVLALLGLVMAALTSAGCQAIADIFQAGVWAGAILVVLIVAVVGFVAVKVRQL